MTSIGLGTEGTPLRARVAWLLAKVQREGLSADEIAENFIFPTLMPLTSPQYLGSSWAVASLEKYDELTQTFARLIMRFQDGRREAVRLAVRGQPPYAIHYFSRFPAPEGVSTRLAYENDAQAIADLERRSPIVDGDVRRAYERADWFAQLRMIGTVRPLVAEVDGRIVGVHVGVLRAAEYERKQMRLLYLCRTRVDPTMRGRHVFPALTGAMVDQFIPFDDEGWGFDTEENYVAISNQRISELATGGPEVDWKTKVLRLTFDTLALGAHADVCSAVAGDLPKIAEILNATHQKSSGHTRVTPEMLSARLSRQPDLYCLGNLVMSTGAVVGVWQEKVVMRYGAAASTRSENVASVFDYGCLRGAEQHLIQALRAQCARLFDRGITRLYLYTSETAPLQEILTPLSIRVELFSYRSRLAEPRSAREAGIFVDPLYF